MENKLPKNWVGTELGNLISIIRGVSYKKDEAFSIPLKNSSLVLRGGNIQDGKVIYETGDNVYVDSEIIGAEQFLKENDVVIVGSTGSKKLIGKAATVEFDCDSVSFGAFLLLLRTEVINKKYHSYFFQTKYYRNTISTLAGGVNINNIRKEYIEKLKFPLPPLPEQERIATKLDTLFAQLDTIRTAMDKVPQLLKNFRQQVLTQAVMGELTKKWREGRKLENLEKLVYNIKNRRIEENPRREAELQKIYSDYNSSIDFMFPEEWIETNLDKICSSFSYGTSSKSLDIGEYPVIRMGNIQGGKIDWSDLKYTSDENEYQKYKLKNGDVLFNRTNSPELVGKTAIYDDSRPAIFAGYLVKISNFAELKPQYLNIVLNTQYAKRWCWENKTDGVSQSNINAQKLSKFTIPFPDPLEQQEIVSRVESLFAKADAIEAKYNALKQQIDKLPQAILHKAFKGELVAQLPTDGDARDLLKEIEKLNKSIKKK